MRVHKTMLESVRSRQAEIRKAAANLAALQVRYCDTLACGPVGEELERAVFACTEAVAALGKIIRALNIAKGEERWQEETRTPASGR